MFALLPMDRIPPKFYAADATFPTEVALQPVGVVHSPHLERHGTPRQAVLPADPKLRGDEACVLELFGHVFTPEATESLAGFDYVWVLAWLHLNRGWRNSVRVPGDTKRRGILSTRAPHRPNPLALSAVRLLRVDGLNLHVERTDLLHGTPIVDIKPYVPYCDAFAHAQAGWVDQRRRPPDN